MAESTAQWLTFRSLLVDWRTQRQTEEGNPARLESQAPGLAAHPLFFGGKIFPLGLQPIGGSLQMPSRTEADEEGVLYGILVDELDRKSVV